MALRKLFAIISPGLLVVLLILVGLLVQSPGRGAAFAAAEAAPPFQAEDYPGPGQDDPGLPAGDDPYPMVTPTAEGQPTEEGQPSPTAEGQQTAGAPTVTPEATIAGSDYPPDAEAEPATSTPVAGDTAAPSPATGTPGATTEEPEAEETPFALQPPASSDGGSGGLALNWTLFWVGFSLPVVLACGVVLYLLDRNPRLFDRKKEFGRGDEAVGLNAAPLPDQSEK